jgi:8-oxo-dGTP pyrophosphatase MutT (NUDIX family)/phosphohistidine phosphatase SixA
MVNKRTIRAGGVVLMRQKAGKAQTLLVHRPQQRDWSLPKGKTNNGETLIECAVRECWEETGIRPVLGPSLGQQSYSVAGRRKTVDYWVGRIGRNHGFTPNAEVNATRWATLKEARSLLSYKRDVQFVEAGFALPETVALVVVRHATALKRIAFKGEDQDRPLTARGQLQAIRVVPILEAYGVSRLVSSPTQRCVQTLLPFSAQSGIKIRSEKALSESAHKVAPDSTTSRAALLARTQKAIALCTHRPVLPEIISALNNIRGFDSDLASTPLRPTTMIVAHRAKRRGKWVIVGTERHETE